MSEYMNDDQQVAKKTKSEKLAEAKLQIKTLEAKVIDLEKQLASKNEAYKYASGRASELDKKIDEMHTLFDGLAGCVSRKTSDDYYGKEYSLADRFASWLAFRLESK